MASFFFRVQSVSRGNGSSAVQRAAYISRARLRDERLNRGHDFRARGGLEHSEILLPAGAPANADWARDRSRLWNVAERSEPRRNARVAREYIVALPHELSGPERIALAREFAQRVADDFHVVADFAVHRAPPGGDPRNHHAHVLTTTRELRGSELGPKSAVELSERDRPARGVASASAQIRSMRTSWAEQVNTHLAEAGLELRVDARSYAERGLARVPEKRLARSMIYLERAGKPCAAAERIRELHAAQQERLLALSRASDPAMPQTHEVPGTASATGAERNEQLAVVSAEPTDRDATPHERDLRAVERWRAYRRAPARDRDADQERAKERSQDRGAEFER